MGLSHLAFCDIEYFCTDEKRHDCIFHDESLLVNVLVMF